MEYDKLGKNIRNARKFKNMTQEKLAEKVDISEVFLSQLENGKNKPSLNTMHKISTALGVSIDSLLHNDTDEIALQIETLLKGRTEPEKRFVLRAVVFLLDELSSLDLT